MADIVVRIPARAEYVHVLRSAVASVAARLDFTYDEIDDLRIAVDEACAHLLSVPDGAESMTLRMTPDRHTLVLLASTDADPDQWPPPGAKQTLAWQVLSALTDDVVFEREGSGPALRLTKKGLESG